VGSWTSSDPVRIVQLIPPVTDDDLALIGPTTEVVQFADDPEPAVHERLAPVFAARPETLPRILVGVAAIGSGERPRRRGAAGIG
jgi:hypothetical protein